MSRPHVYLDYAAATPLDEGVAKTMQAVERAHYANPSARHSAGRQSAKALEDARRRVAMQLGAKSTEIVFTSGSTEGANMAILGVARKYPSARLIASAIEHQAVLEPLSAWQKAGGSIGIVPVGGRGILDGIVDPADVASSIDDDTALVCVMYVNNEIGTIQPIRAISVEIAKIRADRKQRGIKLPLYLYCDAAQAGLKSLVVNTLGVDMLSMGGSKIYGPHGMGFLYIRTGVELEPLVYGGGHEFARRSGTPNVAGSTGLAEALEMKLVPRALEWLRLVALRDQLEADIVSTISGSNIHGNLRFRSPHILNCRFDGVDGETLVAYLDAAGFAVATGAACAAGDEKASHVLAAIGLTAEQVASSLRISLGRSTTAAELKNFVATLAKSVVRLRGMASGEIDR